MASRETTLRQAADKLTDAVQSFARENGDGFSGRDWQGAYEYRDEGYAIAERAFSIGIPEAVSGFIEGEIDAFDESARYLVASAADYRLAELADRPVFAERAAA